MCCMEIRSHKQRISAANAASTAATFGHRAIEIPPGSVPLPPFSLKDQGINGSENRHLAALQTALFNAPGVQFLAYFQHSTGQYEIVSRTGKLTFSRLRSPDGHVVFRVDGIEGANPIPNTDGRALTTLAEEIAAAGGAGKPVASDKTTYPDILKRISQLFDSERAPDLVYIPFSGGDPNHPGTGSHGIPDITQSRAPLIMAGPGIAPDSTPVDHLVRVEDIAPTIAHYLGVQPIIGRNAAGVAQRQLLRWQDGASLNRLVDSIPSGISAARAGASTIRTGAGTIRSPKAISASHITGTTAGAAQRAVMFVIDGASHPVLMDEVAKGNLPNIARLMKMGVSFRNGSLASYPTVTWANHNSLVTGTSPGHHGIVNNSWFDRERGQEQLITDGGLKNSIRTERHVSPEVETLYEAVRRTFGKQAITTSLNDPNGRGATISVLDLHGYGKILKHGVSIIKNYLGGKKMISAINSPSKDEKEYKKTSQFDNIATSIKEALVRSGNPPKLSVIELSLVDNQGHHHGPQSKQARSALLETDRNIGRVLQAFDERGLTESTMFVVTSDHGMEHQSMSGTGGWKQALDGLAASGVKTVESTRFVYLRTMQLNIGGAPLMVGVQNRLAVQVNDEDVDASGKHRPLQYAKVTLTLADGQSVVAVTDVNGIARLDVSPSGGDSAQVMVEHEKFTTERVNVPVGYGPQMR